MWNCAGNVWIYSTYGNFTPVPGEPNYCHPILYWFAFWLTTSSYIVLGVFCCGSCIVMCIVTVCALVCSD